MLNHKIIYIVFITFSICFPQNVLIHIFDKDDLRELSGANVILIDSDNEKIGFSTDKAGKIFIEEIKADKYRLSISYIGYKDYNSVIQIEYGETYSFEISMEIESIIMPELEIISDLNHPYQKLPGSGSIISMREMQGINPLGTQEALEHIPGINSFADDGIGNSRISVGIRGLNPRRSSRILILEDGIPIQPALYVYPNMYYNPPVERIDGIQVIKGAGSIKYGPQTMGGVINYFTSRPANEYGGDIALTLGGNGYASAFTEVTGFGSPKLKNSIQFLAKKGNGFRQNNDFIQYNGTFKSNYSISKDRNIYLKFSNNYENSNATYTGLTEYSFDQDPAFNPKEHDNFKIFRSSLDVIETEKIQSNTIRTRKIYGSYFDRKWWREDDVFILASEADSENPNFQAPGTPFNIIRTGNGKSNFGILRTFYVLGYEQSYSIDSYFINNPTKYEYGGRIYFERFIDDKKVGSEPNAREGIYFEEAETCNVALDNDGNCNDYLDLNNNSQYDDSETVVGQSHHYETIAFSSYLSNSTDYGIITINTGVRFELFEQERIDRLNGAIYLDKTSFEVLPSISFLKSFNKFNLFGGIHRGYTAPSSGALKVTNFVIETGLDLKSEKSWNKELGIRSNRKSNLVGYEFSLFHLHVEDMVAAARGAVFDNLGRIAMYGTELGLKINASKKGFPDIFVSHTYLKSRVIDGMLDQYSFLTSGGAISIEGNSLPYTPENTLVLGLEQSIIKDLKIRFDYKFVDQVYTDFHNLETTDCSSYCNLGIMGPVPSYSIFNLNINYDISKNLNINMIIKNLTDKKYIGSRLHSNPGQLSANMSSGIIPGPARQINLGISYSF